MILETLAIDIQVAIIAAIIALITTLITNFFARYISKKELIEKYRMIYFENQLEAYREFWSILKPISKYPNTQTLIKKKNNEYFLDSKNVQEFNEKMTTFFFSSDGIMLDRDTRSAMFSLRDHLEKLVNAYPVTEKKDIGPKITNKEAKDYRRLQVALIESVREGSNLINLEFSANKIGVKSKKQT